MESGGVCSTLTCHHDRFCPLTWLLLFVIRKFLNRAATEAADRTGQPLPQSVPRAFGTRRAGLQGAEGRLRLKVGHRFGLAVRAANSVVF